MSNPASANPLLDLSSHLTNLIEGAAGAAVAVRSRHRVVASGLIWKPGVVITASDALEADEELSVVAPGGETVKATLAGRDATTDIAVLRTDRELVQPALSPAIETPRVGQLIAAVGRGKDGVVASLGMVSVAGGAWQSMRGGRIDSLIRLDLRLEANGEGAIVLDVAGRWHGMAVFGPHRKPLVIPAATIDRIGVKLLADGRIRRGYLGVGVHPIQLDHALVASHALSDRRASIVVSVDPDGPASKAGVLVGDVIVAFDGAPVSGARALHTRLSPESIGKVADLRMVRAGQITTAKVTVEANPHP